MKIYEKIKSRRKELGLTQAALGDKVGYTQQAIQLIENGKRALDQNTIISIANALNISPADLVIENPFLPTHQIYRIGFVEAGAWTEAEQLPRDEWLPVNYPINDNLKGRKIFALGVRGNSMNKIFPPERTTLICLGISDYCDLVKEGIQNGDFIVAQRVSNDGKYEATVKRYNRLDDNTVVLEAMSSDPRYTNIIVGSENCEYQIIAVVIDYQTKLKDL